MKRTTTAHLAVKLASTTATKMCQDPYSGLVLIHWFKVHKVTVLMAVTKPRSSQEFRPGFLTTHFLNFSKDNYP